MPFPGAPSPRNVCLKDGFNTNHIYELVYEAKDPLVAGLAFAAVRDLVAFLRHGAAGVDNPLKGDIKTTLLFGHSQSGRMARRFLELGFNRDEDGAHRVRRHEPPCRAHPHEPQHPLRPAGPRFRAGAYRTCLYRHRTAGDLGRRDESGDSGKSEGLLDRCTATHTCPKIFQTVTDTEYWQRGMSLATGDLDGKKDIDIPANVRIYDFGDASHIDGAPDATAGAGLQVRRQSQWRRIIVMRALLLALRDWVADGKAPPAQPISHLSRRHAGRAGAAGYGLSRNSGREFRRACTTSARFTIAGRDSIRPTKAASSRNRP